MAKTVKRKKLYEHIQTVNRILKSTPTISGEAVAKILGFSAGYCHVLMRIAIGADARLLERLRTDKRPMAIFGVHLIAKLPLVEQIAAYDRARKVRGLIWRVDSKKMIDMFGEDTARLIERECRFTDGVDDLT